MRRGAERRRPVPPRDATVTPPPITSRAAPALDLKMRERLLVLLCALARRRRRRAGAMAGNGSGTGSGSGAGAGGWDGPQRRVWLRHYYSQRQKRLMTVTRAGPPWEGTGRDVGTTACGEGVTGDGACGDAGDTWRSRGTQRIGRVTGDALKSRGHKGWGILEAREAHGDMEDGGMRGQITGTQDMGRETRNTWTWGIWGTGTQKMDRGGGCRMRCWEGWGARGSHTGDM